MSMPMPPGTPGASRDDTPAPTPSGSAPDPAASQPPPAGQDGQRPADERVNPDARRVNELPAWAQKLFGDLRKEAAEYRTRAKEAAAAAQASGPSPEQIAEQTRREFAQQIGKALGLIDEDKPVDPGEVINRLTAEKEQTARERDAERDRHRRALIELAVHRASGRHGADPDALLDSRSFLRNVRDLDPDDETFAEALNEAIARAVEDNPKFKAATQAGPPAKSGGEFGGGTGGRSSDERSVDDFRAARRASRNKEP